MKNPERVAALIAELRTLTETDFERHRIDVLERDLTAPPTVEVIDDKHQRFDGVVYGKRADNHYYRQTGIHRDVWQYFNGDIPQDYDIHHIDGDAANNAIENLQCITKQEHGRKHVTNGQQIPRFRETFKCVVCGREFDGYSNGRNRYCSKHCQNAFFYHNRHKQEIVCEWCGKTFFGRKNSRFCSGHCATTAHYAKLRAEGKTAAVTKICPVCGKTFECFPSNPHETCSQACGQKLRHQRRRETKS